MQLEKIRLDYFNQKKCDCLGKLLKLRFFNELFIICIMHLKCMLVCTRKED